MEDGWITIKIITILSIKTYLCQKAYGSWIITNKFHEKRNS